jgi:DNA-binding PadR family transcriptional regulator
MTGNRGHGWGPWGFGFMGGGWGPKGPGLRWRFYDRGDLKFVILRLLREKPMHGYEVMRALEEGSGGWYRASPGSVYPTLQMLEDQGYVRGEERNGKKVYEITDAGREYLREHSEVVDEIRERVADFTSSEFRSQMGGLARSFTRLTQTAAERAFKWPNDPDVAAQIREILDRATHELEGVRPKTPGASKEESTDTSGEG